MQDFGLNEAGFTDVRLIGRGGSASVFQAKDAKGMLVAVKVLSGVWEEPDLRRFQREQEALKRLVGVEGVVPILDSGLTPDKTPFFVMPFYEGGPLQNKLDANEPIPTEKAITLAKRAGKILSTAHSRGVYHRDVKPGNLLLDAKGKVWLADFGVTEQLYEDYLKHINFEKGKG